MILEFHFEYIADNNIFEHLLHFYAKGYEYCLSRNDEKIIFQIQAEPEILEAFCESLNGISNSVFLRKFDVKAVEKFGLSEAVTTEIHNEKFRYLTYLNSQNYLQNNQLQENEWSVFCELEISFDKDTFIKIDKDNFFSLLEQVDTLIKNGQKIWIKNHKGVYEFHIFNLNNIHFECDFLLPCDMKAIASVFVCSNENLKLLASLEKPLIRLRFNAIFRKNHNLMFNEFKIKLAEDLFTFALCLKLWQQGYKFLSVKKLCEFQKDFELFSFENNIVVLEGFEFINERARTLLFSKEDKNMSRLSYLISRFKEEAFILELSKEYDDILLVGKELNILKLTLPQSAQEFYEDMRKDKTAAKLLQNFSKEFPLLDEKFDCKANFFSLLCILGRILNLDEDFHKAGVELLELAQSAKLPRGVKIDYRLNEQKEFDYTRTLRSAMSFMLAGVESVNIAYGALESLAYFLRDLYDDLREKKQAQIAVISGSLFENKALLKNTLKHLKDCKLSDVALRI
ncbi:hypothetical protein OQH60_00790 [Campylobacter sp. MIT 21-1685]|uniref:Kae1-like domain-containing protein n=1 Tax=unclassified Campylobacter TaxID=2593542 RepID=UPI00224B5E6E|nr:MULTISPECIES: hypothetical protein [unclassified Campylobacter]MCX2682276.1 hypothetical protein [Campylobacter sp. MIT 21-1684]MCX2750556.1 hypothetical protein [Campylobacter sp. MIT 21-1682]MCX2806896.1 hypothetical protein [Campylobacter sp. MIT 21-1685]